MAQRELRREDETAQERASGERAASPRRLFTRFLGPKARVDLGRRLLAPFLLALVPLFWVADATHRASLTTLGRDQGIFQYIAWAVKNGEVDYRDIRDVNGPLVHMIHSLFLALGGADEHRFHVLELWATGLSFAFVGACIPGLVAKARPRWSDRAGWAAAGAVVLGGQYQLYLYWNQAQRESFCDWFLLPSFALQMARPAKTARSAAWRITLIGALSTITWFGKPSFVIFTAMQIVVLLFDKEALATLRAKIVRFSIGGAVGIAIPMLYLFAVGDPRAFARISFIDVPQIYRFIWAKSAQEIFGEEGPLMVAATGVAASALLFGLIATRELPRRALVIAFAPLCAIANVAVQHKGFGYHFHPLTASTHIAFLLVCAMLWERYRTVSRKKPLGRVAAIVVCVAYALEVTASMKGSPHIRNVWILAGGETPERRTREEYFNTFKSYDFFPWDLRQAAAFLRDKTSANAKVQVYGMDPYLLFLAQRKSATPIIYAYDLNDDAALDGGWSNRPTDLDIARIKAARDAHEHDMLAKLKAAPPEAFVFINKAPLISYPNAWEDFQHCCETSATWVRAEYRKAKVFGEVNIWLRNDVRFEDSPELDPNAPNAPSAP